MVDKLDIETGRIKPANRKLYTSNGKLLLVVFQEKAGPLLVGSKGPLKLISATRLRFHRIMSAILFSYDRTAAIAANVLV